MERALEKEVALLVIDMQKGLVPGPYYGTERNNPEAEMLAIKLLDLFRARSWPIIHVRHSSQDPHSPLHISSPGFQWKSGLNPRKDELIITKSVNSGFIGTHLEDHLRSNALQTLVVVGLTTNHCVSTTVRMAANLGFSPLIVADATAAFSSLGYDGTLHSAEALHQSALASLHQEFGEVLTTEGVIARLSL
ncbi:MAG: cysteine hydrolase [Saprospiraceae bacterium]|nr:cysteine hydrolase [Saprospiraceae bacterium]